MNRPDDPAPRPDRRRRIAIVADLLEERWPSMDLVAEMLCAELQTAGMARDLDVEMVRPSLGRRRDGAAAMPGFERTFDRFVHRFWDYPRWLRARARDFDVFHVVDHSYAHLVHVLPAQKTVVTCHDVDAFLSLVQPELGTSKLPNVLTRLVLSGIRKAAYVTCDSVGTYDDIRRYDLVPADRLVVVPNGTHASYSACPAPASDADIDRMLDGCATDVVELLHVGSTIPRKRIDVLLRVVAAVRDIHPAVRLLKAGGMFTRDQRDLVRSLNLERTIVELPFLNTNQLAALYRRATMLLVTSDREGFGLPVAEAMACGIPVVATDLAVLREVGGPAGVYCPSGDIPAWRDAVLGLLRERGDPAACGNRRRAGFEQAGTFSSEKHAASMTRIYERVGQGALDRERGRKAPVAVWARKP